MPTKRQHLLRRSQMMNPDLQTILLAAWPVKWPSLKSDKGWTDFNLDEVDALLDVFELAQWAIDTPFVVLKGHGPGKLCLATSRTRDKVRAVLMGLPVRRKKAIEARAHVLGIPNVRSSDFTEALGHYLIDLANQEV